LSLVVSSFGLPLALIFGPEFFVRLSDYTDMLMGWEYNLWDGKESFRVKIGVRVENTIAKIEYIMLDEYQRKQGQIGVSLQSAVIFRR